MNYYKFETVGLFNVLRNMQYAKAMFYLNPKALICKRKQKSMLRLKFSPLFCVGFRLHGRMLDNFSLGEKHHIS